MTVGTKGKLKTDDKNARNYYFWTLWWAKKNKGASGKWAQHVLKVVAYLFADRPGDGEEKQAPRRQRRQKERRRRYTQ